MARILICEPHLDIQMMLLVVLRRLGHEPVVSDGSREQLLGVDAIVLEPGSEEALGLATWTHEHASDVALVCTSIFPPWHETEALSPDAYLVKPFALYEFENALSDALARRAGPRAAKGPVAALEQV